MALAMRPGILEMFIRGITTISDKSQDGTRPTGYVKEHTLLVTFENTACEIEQPAC